MPISIRALRAAGPGVAIIVAGLASTVQGEEIHPVEITVEVDDAQGWSETFLPEGTNPFTRTFNYVREGYTNPANDDWSMDWDLNASPFYDPAAVVNGNFVVRNTSAAETLAFRIRVLMPLVSSGGADAHSGSAAITVASGGSASLATVAGTSLWAGLIDGTVAGSLYPFDYSLDVPEGGGSADDNALLAGQHGGAESDVAIQITFTLTPGAAMTITSAFTIGSTVDHNWTTLAGGGGVSTGGPYRLSVTMNQPDAGTSNGGPYTATGGFWSIYGPTPFPVRVAPCETDIDDDRQIGFSDLLAVLNAFGPCDGCPEDLDGSGEVDFQDLLMVLGTWGPCD